MDVILGQGASHTLISLYPGIYHIKPYTCLVGNVFLKRVASIINKKTVQCLVVVGNNLQLWENLQL